MGLSSFLTSILRQPGISLGISGLGLLLLVIVLLSVPGPVQSLHWFEMDSPTEDGQVLKAGVMGWCWAGTSNCTYATLNENEYLVSLFDVGSAITVKALVPLSCYWTIVSVVCWTGLAVTAPLGYRTEGGQELARHLYFNILEVAVLCVQLFGCVLTWLAFGFTDFAVKDLQSKSSGNTPIRIGNVGGTIATAATISMLGFGLGAYGLFLRIRRVSSEWKEETQQLISACSERPLKLRGIEHIPGQGMVHQTGPAPADGFVSSEVEGNHHAHVPRYTPGRGDSYSSGSHMTEAERESTLVDQSIIQVGSKEVLTH